MTEEKLLALWRGIPTPDGWQMDDIIVQFGRKVELQAMTEMARNMFSTAVPPTTTTKEETEMTYTTHDPHPQCDCDKCVFYYGASRA